MRKVTEEGCSLLVARCSASCFPVFAYLAVRMLLHNRANEQRPTININKFYALKNEQLPLLHYYYLKRFCAAADKYSPH